MFWLLTNERSSFSAAALKNVLIRFVVAVFKPGGQMAGELAFEGRGELLRVVV